MVKNYVKPPVGPMPKRVWLERRATELHNAIGRYLEWADEHPWSADYKAPMQWAHELGDVCDDLVQDGNKDG